MRNIPFLSAVFLLLGLFLCSGALADEAVCEPSTKKVCSGKLCSRLGETVLDTDQTSIIACLHKDGNELRWINTTRPQSAVVMIGVRKDELNNIYLAGFPKCENPYMMGGFTPCNSGCFRVCANADHAGGIISDWNPGSLNPDLPEVMCTCFLK